MNSESNGRRTSEQSEVQGMSGELRDERVRSELHRSSVTEHCRYWSLLITALVVLVTARALSSVPTHPVRGGVLVAGEPVVGAIVEFHPIGRIDFPFRTPCGQVSQGRLL